ncbi:hypothetical protein ACFC1B_26650 [Streptomyces xiamenensis]|uniref:hypothetical protein n=1 Tax=Streptomyces xiamenensis TaxID=408015 RepID=UPI0035DF66B1
MTRNYSPAARREEITHRAKKRTLCMVCGGLTRRQRTFTGQPSTASVLEPHPQTAADVRAELAEAAAIWQAKPETCAACITDTSAWGRAAARDGLVPADHAITLGIPDMPRARIHFAFAEDYPAIDQADLIAQLRAAITQLRTTVATDLT